MKNASLGAAMKHALLSIGSIFLLAGNMVATPLGAVEANDRSMIDMLFWNVVAVMCAVVPFL
jgi:hypothetical protein